MVSLAVSVSKGFVAGRLGAVFDRAYYFDPTRRHDVDLQCQELVRRELADLDACFTESNLGRARFITPDQVLVGGIQPNLILAMLLGAEFVPGMDKDADVTPACCREADPHRLPRADALLRHPLVQTFDEQIRALRQASPYRPIPPFFWDGSGRAAVHGALTTAQKLVGEGVFADLLEDPGRCRAIMRWVTEANVTLVKHFAATGEMEITGVHVGECSACMVSPKVFEEFLLPEVVQIGEALGPVRLHSCGRSDHFLGLCAGAACVTSVDVGGQNSVARIRMALGTGFPISIAPLAETLRATEADGLLEWTRRVLEENQGGPLQVVCHVEPGYNLTALRAAARLIGKSG